MAERGHTMARATIEVGGKESHWRLILGRWLRSGLSVADFCRREGFNAHSFYWWRRELQRRDQAGAEPAFLPVHLLDDHSVQAPNRDIEIILAGGRRVRVAPGFDPATLTQVLDLLEGGRSC
jgi:transposase-like protein